MSLLPHLVAPVGHLGIREVHAKNCFWETIRRTSETPCLSYFLPKTSGQILGSGAVSKRRRQECSFMHCFGVTQTQSTAISRETREVKVKGVHTTTGALAEADLGPTGLCLIMNGLPLIFSMRRVTY